MGWRYRFDGVELDLVARRLRIDGEERPASQRALQLLELLCAQPGVLVGRNQLIDALWPGGQVVSDEALTQIIFRTRAVLGPYAERLATVRGAGLRLDAQVRREAVSARDVGPVEATIRDDAGPTQPAEQPAAVALPSAATPPRAAPRRRRWLLATLLLACTALAALAWQMRSDAAANAPIDIGYGLDAVDAYAADPATPALLREAFRQDGVGDRERARALLEAVHSGDAHTPLPALFLALWAFGVGDTARMESWLALARARLAPLHSANLSALLNYIEAERDGDARAVVRHAGAVLDLRPGAWQMRTARAHLLLSMQLRDAAREELQQVDVSSLHHRKLAMAVADRAALGDVDGAQAVLDRLHDTMDVPEREFLRGRIAWSRGDLPAARDAFAAAIEAGEKRARFALMQRALIHIGIIEMQLGEPAAAMRWLERAHRTALQGGAVIDRFDTALLLAQLHADAGDAATARTFLAAALEVTNHRDTYVRLFVLRLAPDLLPSVPEHEALPAARRAYNAGRLDEAGTALDRAIANGALDGELADETRLLQAQLGRTPAAELPLDPPFPPASRHATRHALARFVAGRSGTTE